MEREREHTKVIAELGFLHDFKFWCLLSRNHFLENYNLIRIIYRVINRNVLHNNAMALYTRNRTCECDWFEGKNRQGIEMQGKRRIDAYFDWVEEKNWRTSFPFGIKVRRNHDKDLSTFFFSSR